MHQLAVLTVAAHLQEKRSGTKVRWGEAIAQLQHMFCMYKVLVQSLASVLGNSGDPLSHFVDNAEPGEPLTKVWTFD